MDQERHEKRQSHPQAQQPQEQQPRGGAGEGAAPPPQAASRLTTVVSVLNLISSYSSITSNSTTPIVGSR